jgi:hypothetical protein
MKKFIDKLIGRFRDCTTIEDYGELFVSLDEVENIIYEFAEEYINTSTNTSTNKSSGWISVAEKLPELNEYVLCSVSDKYATHEVIISKFDNEVYWHNGRITAWQPLPQPYAEQKQLTWQQQTMNRFERVE